MSVYKTIVADPPWPETGGGRIKRGADAHYPLLPIKEIEKMADLVQSLCDPEGCHLYLWATNNYLHDALHVMEAWGFRYITCLTWAKDRMGLGQYFRGLTEHCLFGVRGNLPYRTREDGMRAQGRTLITAAKQEHSHKPDALMDYAELVSHPPRIEMFARRRRFGWDVWGDQV